jgi:hypothetical protein
MRAPSRKSLVRLLLPVAAVAVLVVGTAGARAATVTKFPPETSPFTLAVNDDCRGGLAGTLTGTSVTSVQSVDTLPAHQGFHFRFLETDTFRVDFVDGSYALGSFVHPFEFNSSFIGTGGDGNASNESTDIVAAHLTVYDATGDRLGTETVHMREHITVLDLANDGAIVRVSFSDAHVACGF